MVTRISEIVGSRSRGSSGPRPNTSSSTSSMTRSFSARLSGVCSSSTSFRHGGTDFRARALASQRRKSFQVDAIDQLAVNRELQLLVFGTRAVAVRHTRNPSRFLPRVARSCFRCDRYRCHFVQSGLSPATSHKREKTPKPRCRTGRCCRFLRPVLLPHWPRLRPLGES